MKEKLTLDFWFRNTKYNTSPTLTLDEEETAPNVRPKIQWNPKVSGFQNRRCRSSALVAIWAWESSIRSNPGTIAVGG